MSETVRSFERGLRVIRALGDQRDPMTLAAVARAAELTRATARRLLLTLVELGYVRHRDERYELTPRVLDLGYAYLSSARLPDLATPHLDELSRKLLEASSLGVLDGADVVYVARVPANRVMAVSIGVGTRFPAHRTSLGQVLLAGRPDSEVAKLWSAANHTNPTERTIITLGALRDRLQVVRERRWALVDGELEIGVRSIAAPVMDRHGDTVAAINVSTHASRTPEEELLERHLPALQTAAERLTSDLSTRVASAVSPAVSSP